LILLAAFPSFVKSELLPIRTHSTADGLAADRVDCIFPDSSGFIWFCTPRRACRVSANTIS
jgi:hypothetical protein